MSYILDALRKADAERERDPARGIHAQPAALPHEAPSRGPLRVALGAGAVALVAAGAWLLMPGPATVIPAAVVAAPVPAPVPAAVPAPVPVQEAPAPAPAVIPVAASVSPPAPPALPAPAPAGERAAAPVLAAAAPAATRQAAAASASAAPAAVKPAAAPVPAPAAPAAPAAVQVAVAAPAAPPAAPPAAAPVTTAPAATPAERILAFAELPPDVQREMQRLKISGGVHSDNASQRMLIVGGQVMTEGSEIAPGVLLEQIRARTAVLKYRAYRFSVAY